MDKTCKIGVAGAGVFGGYHAGKCAAHPRVDFIGIFDPNEIARTAGAAKHGVKAYADFADMLDDIDAVIIAAPASYHGDMVLAALRAGKHVLVEKPVATDVDTAKACIDLAADKGVVLQVGHQERFVARAIGLDKITARPRKITTERMGPFNPRGQDVSVTLDLMTHDLDLVLMIMGEMPERVDGQVAVVCTNHPDTADAVLHWRDVTAHMRASRVAEAYSRKMTLEYASGTVNIDFNGKTLSHDTPFVLNVDFGADPSASDSLGAATDSFVRAILDGDAVVITGQDGLNAMRLALMIDANQEGTCHE
ncbi:Gfo/Idh/MocA family protein [Fretibacter rubidus]|uniref:Gfo/Idh/MocA family protein n=1 Tax=Fretibacter rubidus TaxID=570162 RepID=UPI00352ACC8A